LSNAQDKKSELLEKIKYLLNQKEKFKEISLKNIDYAENTYSTSVVIRKIFEIYKSTI